MFASRTVPAHLFRGCIGFTLLGSAVYLFSLGSPWEVLFGSVLAILGFLVLRGCPACWVIGLIMTIFKSDKTCIPCSRRER